LIHFSFSSLSKYGISDLRSTGRHFLNHRLRNASRTWTLFISTHDLPWFSLWCITVDSLSDLPDLPADNAEKFQWQYEPCVWFFHMDFVFGCVVGCYKTEEERQVFSGCCRYNHFKLIKLICWLVVH
jgi:hypothetical protein